VPNLFESAVLLRVHPQTTTPPGFTIEHGGVKCTPSRRSGTVNSFIRIKPDEPIVLDLGGGNKLVLVAECTKKPAPPKPKVKLIDLGDAQIGAGAGILAVIEDQDLGATLAQSPTLDLTSPRVLTTIASPDAVTFERS